jgi:hypothetical protein
MIKIYGIREQLDPIKDRLSDAINQSMVEALTFPEDKQARRFFPMEAEDYFTPAGRSPAYTLIEIVMMRGRSEEARRRLIEKLFQKLEIQCQLSPIDVEITILEAPPCNFGFRGLTGDEANLDYRVDV